MQLEDIATEFIQEILRQIIFKNKYPGKRPKSVGLKTEKKLRELLNEVFVEEDLTLKDHKINSELILTPYDFIGSGVRHSKSFVNSFNQFWKQCDLYAEKNGRVILLGEIKTTTSALHNICGLINKNLTTIRKFRACPLSIILYPDIKPETLAHNHKGIVNGLLTSKLISEHEYNKLKNCFFILTNIGWRGGLEKRTRELSSLQLNHLNLAIEEKQLFQTGDINLVEWGKLKDYINVQRNL